MHCLFCICFSLRYGFQWNKNQITTIRIKYLCKPKLIHDEQEKNYRFIFYGCNSTHLWSMRLADENYFRLARLLPCRTVEYTRGPKPAKIDSCDQSLENEYSLPNILQAQKWLYDHQHPADCTNKRFAIIYNYALSGFGSTVHQVAWAFGMALADDRIAVYHKPGNWVRKIKFIEIKPCQWFISVQLH